MTRPAAGITRFRGAHGFLSNFWIEPFEIEVRGQRVTARSGEYAYQAAKAARGDDIAFVLDAEFPNEAKRRGRRVEIRPDWEQVKVAVMRKGLISNG